MRIILLRPTYGSRFQVNPPLSLGYLSASLKKNGYSDVSLIDGSLSLLTPVHAAGLAAEKRPDIVGIQVYTGSHNWTKEFIPLLKARLPNVIVIVGGPHITALQGLALDHIGADYGVMGEGETAIVEFAEHIEGKRDASSVSGLIYANGGRWCHAAVNFGFLRDANELPFPDWDLIDPRRYYPYLQGASMPIRGKRPVPILTSRGCPYRCTFCSSGLTNKRRMRYRDPANIIAEMKMLRERFGADEIFFTDDNLTMDTARAEAIFDMMIAENVRMHWRAPNGIRIDRLTEALVGKMARSGGYFVGLGVETGDQDIMKKIRKHLDLAVVAPVVSLFHKHGIKVSGFFMCGMRGETEEHIERSMRFALSVPFDRIQVSNYIPYPGSEDFEAIFEPMSDAYAARVDAFQKNETVPSFQDISLPRIIALQERFIKRFYLRPRVLLSLLLNIRLSQIKAILEHPWIRRWFSKEKQWYDEQ
ncbi:MAG: radical SAM protein [Spirochaetota bacterium]